MAEQNLTRRFKVGDLVEFLPAYSDPGDEELEWVVVSEEEKGRVDVRPVNLSLSISPVYTVEVAWLRARSA